MRATLTVVALLSLVACTAEEPPPAAPPEPAPAAAPEEPAADPAAAALPEVRYYMLDKSCPYCRDIKRTIEGSKDAAADAPPALMKMYEGKVNFTFRWAYDAQNKPIAEIEQFDFGMSGHGLVAFDPDGERAFKIDGHLFNRAQMIESIDKMLAAQK